MLSENVTFGHKVEKNSSKSHSTGGYENHPLCEDLEYCHKHNRCKPCNTLINSMNTLNTTNLLKHTNYNYVHCSKYCHCLYSVNFDWRQYSSEIFEPCAQRIIWRRLLVRQTSSLSLFLHQRIANVLPSKQRYSQYHLQPSSTSSINNVIRYKVI